jgi:hypothetical protein
MFNPRISGIFAGAGFILSFLVGLVTGAHFPLILIRALIFAAVFFALASAAYGAAQLYLPELFADDSGDSSPLGGQVDISVGDEDGGGISLESGGLGDDLNEFLENPGNSGGDTLDHTGEAVYTGEGALEEIQGPALPGDSVFSPGEADSVDMLPDLDAMSGAFSAAPAPAGGEAMGAPAPAGSFGGGGGGGRPDSRPKQQGLDEDFSVKEMASAIQTILKRENKG